MHEAEKTLTDDQFVNMGDTSFMDHIFDILERDAPGNIVQRSLSASAAQRAEAFLKTIGKWKE